MEGGRNSHATSLILNRRYYMLLFLSFDPPSFPPSLPPFPPPGNPDGCSKACGGGG